MTHEKVPDFGFRDRITIKEFAEASARKHEYYQKRREEKQKSEEFEARKASDSSDFLIQFQCTCGVRHLLLSRQDKEIHFLD